MRIVVTGATGNVGTSLVRALVDDPAVDLVVGIARRPPASPPPGTAWHALDVATDDLGPAMRGADAVVHLAWAIQPARDMARVWRTNVLGTRRVAEAAVAAGARALVHASSVGVYSPGPKDRPVDESWPRQGTPSSFYAVHKAECERRLDVLERHAPGLRVVRMRPALCFKREAASGVRRLFAGPLLPSPLARASRLPFVPDVPGLRVQALHSDDAAEAYRLAVTSDAAGAFNVAAEPILDAAAVAEALGARRVPVPAGLARALMDGAWRLRLQPSPPGWLDLGLAAPLLDSSRARERLGWRPRRTALEALRELLDGIADGAGADTPPLSPGAGGPARLRELAGGVGSREP